MCNSCNKSLIQNRSINTNNTPTQTLQTCDYTREMLLSWKDKLNCVADNDLYNQVGITKIQLNSFLGIVYSGLNMEYNICYLASKLETLQPYIIKIINFGTC